MKLGKRKVSLKTEILAGLTSFMTMAYVLAVQPTAIVGDAAVLTDAAGAMISKEGIVIMCALISGLITIFMGLYADMPFALSTAMGTNFMLGAMVQSGALTFASLMTITLIAGLIFIILTLLGVRDLIVRIIPKNIKIGISAAVGFFLVYMGFKNSGIGSFANGISLGDFTDPAVQLAIGGLLLIAVLSTFKVNGSILISIVVITILSIPLGITSLPETLIQSPDFSQTTDLVFNFSFENLLTSSTLVLIFIVFIGDFFSTLGTVLGAAKKADMLDENGDFPEIKKPFLVDAIGTTVGSMGGCTTITTFVESTSGIGAGGRTGITAITTGICFLLSMFAAPLFLIIPNAATGPALIYVGFLMISGFAEIDFSEFTDTFGPLVMVAFTLFTGTVPNGIAAGILAHATLKLCTGKYKEVHPFLYVLCIPLVLYFLAI